MPESPLSEPSFEEDSSPPNTWYDTFLVLLFAAVLAPFVAFSLPTDVSRIGYCGLGSNDVWRVNREAFPCSGCGISERCCILLLPSPQPATDCAECFTPGVTGLTILPPPLFLCFSTLRTFWFSWL